MFSRDSARANPNGEKGVEKMDKFLIFAVLAVAISLLYSCTTDIESAEDVLKKAESSSSDGSSSSIGGLSSVVSLSSTGGSSSAVQGVSSGGSSQSVSVFCDFGGGDCREFNKDACLAFGQVVESCPGIAASSSSLATPSSGSPIPSSSSVVLSGTVFCEFSGTCSPISAEACALLGGTFVQSCPESSSSAPPSSSSLIEPSSNSVVPSSSSVPLSSSSVVESSSSIVPSSSSYGDLCAGFVEGTEIEHYGKMKKQFCDERDGNKYVYVVIGTQTWMAENLKYNATNSKCYTNNNNNCVTYGRMYDWETAKADCPNGWHLPSQAEWNVLGDDAKKLKATSVWRSGNGTDDYGFSALPGGYGGGSGDFGHLGYYGEFWSASEGENSSKDAYRLSMNYISDSENWDSYGKDMFYSVRCLQN